MHGRRCWHPLPTVSDAQRTVPFRGHFPRVNGVVFVVFGVIMGTMNDEWLTTGETASMLGVSRQHVVNLCDRGELRCSRAGTHRRIRRADVERILEPHLTREEEKSLWLHRAVLGPLMIDPGAVLGLARQNVQAWLPRHRADGMAVRYLELWQNVLDGGVDDVVEVLTGTDEMSRELRQNSPFAGVLSDTDRRQILRSFREHWDQEHSAA